MQTNYKINEINKINKNRKRKRNISRIGSKISGRFSRILSKNYLEGSLAVLLLSSLILLVVSVYPVQLQAEGIAERLNLTLGEGSAEIADNIYRQLRGRADLFLYEAFRSEDEEEVQVSTIMFLVELDEGFEIHNLPLRTMVTREEAERLALAVNDNKEADYIELNLSYFIDIIDLYGEVEVDTAQGSKKMDSQAARDYMERGLENREDYPFDRVQRQEQVLWAIRDEMEAQDGLPSIPGLISVFYRGLRDIDTSLGFFRGLSLGINFIREAPDNVAFYQPDAPDYEY